MPETPLVGKSVACSIVCVGEVCVFAARCVVLTLITSWIADLGSVSIHNQLRERTRKICAHGVGGSKLTFSAVGLGLELPGTSNLSLGLDGSDALDESVDLVGDLVVLLEGVVHAGTDVVVELVVGHVAESQLTVDLLSLGRADDTASDDDGDVANALDGRVQPVLLDFLGEEGGAEGLGGCVDHGLGHGDRL